MKLASTACAVALLTLALVRCGGEDETATDPAALEGPAWTVSDGVAVPGWERVAPSISFDQGSFGGSNGCNSYGGSYETDGSSLRLSEIVSTTKGCPPPAAEVEQSFMADLEAASEWRVEDGELVLAGGQGALRFRAASPEGSWRATSILQGDAVTLLAGAEVTADIADDTISGSSGCNTYSGEFSTEGSTISIGALGGTEMACVTPAGVMGQEEAFLNALPQAAEFRIENGGLVLLTAQGTIVATFEPAS